MEKWWGVRKEINHHRILNTCNIFQSCPFFFYKFKHHIRTWSEHCDYGNYYQCSCGHFSYLQLQSHFLHYFGIFWDRLLETNNSTETVQLFIPLLDNYYQAASLYRNPPSTSCWEIIPVSMRAARLQPGREQPNMEPNKNWTTSHISNCISLLAPSN